MDGGTWQAAVHGVAKSWARLSDFTFTFHFSLSCIGEGNGNPLQCSCLENPRDGGAWWVAAQGGRTESDTTEATQQQQHAYKKNKVEQWEIFIGLNPEIHLKILSQIKIGRVQTSGKQQQENQIWVCVCACTRAKSLQLYPVLCNPMDCSLPGSSVHGISQIRILEWVEISSSRGSS